MRTKLAYGVFVITLASMGCRPPGSAPQSRVESDAGCFRLPAFDYASATLEERLDFYVAHIATSGQHCPPEDMIFRRQRGRDLTSLSPDQKRTHFAREMAARNARRVEQQRVSWLARCGDRDVAWFDPAPDHPWNQLYRSLYVRRDAEGCYWGLDALDPYLFPRTTDYLRGAEHSERLAHLARFVANDDQRFITDALTRALLQRDLLSIHHWAMARAEARDAAAPAALALAAALRPAIRAIALPESVIRSLPDNLDRRFAGYVSIAAKDGPAAPVHLRVFHYGSAFFPMIRLPEGESATHRYLSSLAAFAPRQLTDKSGESYRNPATPQFPSGTEFLLVRRSILWSRENTAVIAPLVESVQGRKYLNVAYTSQMPDRNQTAFKSVLSHERLYIGDQGGFRELGLSDLDHEHFLTMDDPIERKRSPTPALGACLNCHAQQDLTGHKVGSGIHTVHTYDRSVTMGDVPADVSPGSVAMESRAVLSAIQTKSSWIALARGAGAP